MVRGERLSLQTSGIDLTMDVKVRDEGFNFEVGQSCLNRYEDYSKKKKGVLMRPSLIRVLSISQ